MSTGEARGGSHESAPEEAWSDLLHGWLGVVQPACAGCGYPLRGVPQPLCPECGRRVTRDDLVRAMLPANQRARRPEAKFWTVVRSFGLGRAWLVEVIVVVALGMLADARGAISATPLLGGAIIGLLAMLPVIYFHAVATWILNDHCRFWGLQPPSEGDRVGRFFSYLRGLIGLWIALCEAALLLLVLLP